MTTILNREIKSPLSLRLKKSSPGFTLMEILAVLIIITILLSIGSRFIFRSSVNLKQSAYLLTRDIQGLSVEAVKNSKIYRLSFADNKQNYSIEEFVPPAPKPKTTDREALQKWEEDERLREQLSADERTSQTRVDRGKFKVVKKKSFKDPTTLESFVAARTMDEKTSQDKPDRSLLFYPSGEMDDALIVLTDGKGAFFSLETDPLTGRVTDIASKISEQN